MFRPIHRGYILNQAQLDALVPLLNEELDNPNERTREQLEAAAELLFKAAGCEVNDTNNKRAAPEVDQPRGAV